MKTADPGIIATSGIQRSTAPPRSRWPLRLALLGVLLLLLGGVQAYRYWQQMQRDLQHLNRGLSRIGTVQQKMQGKLLALDQVLKQQTLMHQQLQQLVTQKNTFEQQQRLLRDERAHMEQREVALRSMVAELRLRLGQPDAHWVLTEAAYLVKLAQRRLQLARDADTAIAALQAARQRLLDADDPRWAAVRADIGQHITALQRWQQTANPALNAQLDKAQALLPQLEPKMSIHGRHNAGAGSAEAARSRTLTTENLLDDVLRELKGSVRIQYHDSPLQELLVPGQEALLRQNLQLYLDMARLALLQNDANTFTDNLQRAESWVRRYFRASELRRKLLVQLHDLSGKRLQQTLPDLSATLNALQKQQLQLQQADAAESQP